MAKELFRKALNSEYKYQSSTQGLAPSIALLVIKADHLLEAFGCNTTMKEITNAAIDIQVAFKEFVRDYVGNVTSEIIIVKNFFLNHKEFLKQRDLLGNSGNIERDVWILLLLMVIFTLLLYGLFVRQYDS